MFGGMPTDTFTQTLGVKSLEGANKPKTTLFFVDQMNDAMTI